MRSQRVPRVQRGFTLIEVMVASAFFIISLTAIFSLHVSASKMTAGARNFDVGTSILLNMGELIQVLAPQDVQTLLTTANGKGYDRNGIPLSGPGANAFFTLNTSVIQSNGTYKHLILKVTWTESGAASPHAITTDTLVNLP